MYIEKVGSLESKMKELLMSISVLKDRAADLKKQNQLLAELKQIIKDRG